MNKICAFLTLFVLIPFVSAIVTVQAPDETPVLIVGSDSEKVSYSLILKTNGPSADFQIYSLVGVELSPSTVYLEQNVPTTITLTAKPIRRLLDTARGVVKFEYEIFNTNQGVTKGSLLMELVTLEDSLFVRPISVEVGDTEASFILQNLKRVLFDNLHIELSSKLADAERRVTLEPFELANLTVELDTDAVKRLVAGTYPLTVRARYQGAEGTLATNIKYLEQGGVAVAEYVKGTIIRTKTTEKTNEGNVPVIVTINEKRDIFTRLLTNHDPAPESSSKRGFYVLYTWQKQLAPAETLAVQSTTNYTLPVIIFIIIILLVIAVRFYLQTGVTLIKRVSYVRTKGGEFALKVTLHAKSHTSVQNVVLTDRIPHAMKLYEPYGVKPHTVDEGTRTITWNLSHLNAGEERIFSYIIYSKIRVVGSFELPLAHVRYTHKGKAVSVFSNKTSFAAEISHSSN